MIYLFESLPNEITVSSARGVLGGALNDKGGGAVDGPLWRIGRWRWRAVDGGEIVQTAVSALVSK